MDRQEAIKFKLMPEGHIRGFDGRKGSGITEWQVYPSHTVFHALTTCGRHQRFLITDKAILNALKRAAENS